MRDLLKAVTATHGHFFRKYPLGSISILMYHRITGDLPVELDLPFEVFRRQIAWLADSGSIIPYHEAVDRLLTGKKSGQHAFAITFDDAYEDFYTHAWPVLKEYGLPATLFVPTRFIDEPIHLPLSRKVSGAERKMRPMTWDQIREVATDPLILIGSHTHNHPDLVNLSDPEIAQEMLDAADRFKTELGFVPADFAYPRGLWDSRVQKVVSAYCRTAAVVEWEVATPENTARYAIPRVPIRRSDGERWFESRIKGKLIGEEKIIKFIKQIGSFVEDHLIRKY